MFAASVSSTSSTDTINPDEIVVEIISPSSSSEDSEDGCNVQGTAFGDDSAGEQSTRVTTSSSASTSSAGGEKHYFERTVSDSNSGHAFTEVTLIDSFAKGKVLNFLKRMSKHSKPQELFSLSDEREVQEDGTESLLVRCRLRLTLPHPHHHAVAEGIAQTDRDAEHLAAMHAQRILDTLGIHLFGLPSMQQRHAEAVRATGRWAPGPNDKMKPQGTALPPPLRMVTLSQEAVSSVHASGATPASRDEDINDAPPAAPQQQQQQLPQEENECASAAAASEGDVKEDDAAAGNATTPAEPKQQSTIDSVSSSSSSSSTAPPLSDATAAVTDQAIDPLAGGGGNKMMSDAQQLYCLAPWVYSALNRPPPLAANITDATEAGTFQLVNVVSTRCSGSKLAISLPCIFDKSSLERITKALEYQYQKSPAAASGSGGAGARNVMRDMKLAHVLLPGTSQRMHVAELVVDRERMIVARGKASEPQVAMHLCAMHAELLMDHFSIPVFPDEAAKQSEHAMHALESGRWAPGFNPKLLPAALRETLVVAADEKQQQERDVSHHDGADVATKYFMSLLSGITGPPGDDVPVPLPLKQLSGGFGDAEGLPALSRAQYRSVAERLVMLHNELANSCTETQECNPSLEMLREAVRAIRHFNLHGRSFYRSHYVVTQMGEQYRATLVLVPVLESMGRVRGGIGVGRSPQHAVELAAFHAVDVLCTLGIPVYSHAPEKQRALAEKRKSLGLSFVYPPSAADDDVVETDEQRRQRMHDLSRRKLPPGLQLIEALGENRPLASADLIRSIQSQKIHQFEIVKDSDNEIVERGNKDKVQVHAYMTRTGQLSDGSKAPTPFAVQLGIMKNSTHLHCVVAMELKILVHIEPQISSSSYSSLPIINKKLLDSGEKPSPLFDPEQLTHVRTVVAYGASLKRRDADRMCFMHAAEILRRHGINVDAEETILFAERKRVKAASAAALVEAQQAEAKRKRAEAQKQAEAARALMAAQAAQAAAKRKEQQEKMQLAQKQQQAAAAAAARKPVVAAVGAAKSMSKTTTSTTSTAAAATPTAAAPQTTPASGVATAVSAAAVVASSDLPSPAKSVTATVEADKPAIHVVVGESAAPSAVEQKQEDKGDQPATTSSSQSDEHNKKSVVVDSAKDKATAAAGAAHREIVAAEVARLNKIELPTPYMHRLLDELLKRESSRTAKVVKR